MEGTMESVIDKYPRCPGDSHVAPVPRLRNVSYQPQAMGDLLYAGVLCIVLLSFFLYIL